MSAMNIAAESYSAIADKYDDSGNETSFWGTLARSAFERLSLKPRYRCIVDVGCGTGLALDHLQGRAPAGAKLIGLEPAEQMRALAAARNARNPNVEIKDGRFEALPLPNACVDYLYSIWAFHWASDPWRAADEIRRVLKADADCDLWFVGMNNGHEFARQVGSVLRRYVGIEERLRAASTTTTLDRDAVEQLFSFLGREGLTITEETETHFDSLEAHWAWQVRSEAHYSVVPLAERPRFDQELRSAIAALGDERGVPYTRHSFHVRRRCRGDVAVSVPGWLGAAKGPAPQRPFVFCALSATSEDALCRGASALGSELGREAGTVRGDVRAVIDGAHSSGRHRAALVGRDAADLVHGLEIVARGAVPPLGASGPTLVRPVVAFLFSGQGGERAGMARELYQTCPAFRAGIDACASHADPLLGSSLVAALYEDARGLADDGLKKVALFAVQYALAQLWISWGVRPSAVVGHSLGEYAAACVAGMVSLPDAIRLVVDRGRIMQEYAEPGAMCAVRTTEERLAPFLVAHEGTVVVSAVNSRDSLTLSGAAGPLASLCRELGAQGIKTTPLDTFHAFHSPLMQAAAEPLRLASESATYRASELSFVSAVDEGQEREQLEPAYWVRHMLQPVRFVDALETLRKQGVTAYVEIGPAATLVNFAAQWLGEPAAAFLASLGGDEGDFASLLTALARLQVQGVDVDWARFSPEAARHDLSSGALPGSPDPAHSTAWARELAATATERRLDMARRLVRAELADVLGAPVAETEDLAGLMELGLDSVRLVALARRLSKRIERRVSDTIAFSRPTVAALAEYLLEALSLAVPAAATRPRAATDVAGSDDEPIAIVGSGCRLPGGVDDLAGLWRLLESRANTAAPPSPERYKMAGWSPSDQIGSTPASQLRASFLDDVAAFDAGFFGIPPHAASRMDPVHRLLLEVSWQALEDAGIVPGTLAGTETGLFIGVGPSEYVGASPGSLEFSGVDAYTGLGTMPSVAAGRIAHTLGLEGPCLTVDTACSSSLVALHLACQSLRRGECAVAIAGAASLLLSTTTFGWLGKSNALADDGLCKTFSADANGYGRGEGCAVCVLKRLRDAQAAGDRILAVIRGSAIRHDGVSSGLTAPNGRSQEAVISRALEDASCSASSVGYVEAHGTGTPLGDPIEVEALARVYGQSRHDDTSLLLGSVKTNLGHLEYVAGMAGLLKVVASMQHGLVPAHLHAEALNPRISWAELPVKVVREQLPWPAWNTPRRAGLSSFGISGTNAHVILEEAPARPASEDEAARDAVALPLLLSARDERALREQAARWASWLRDGGVRWQDAVTTAALGRTKFDHRAVVLASTSEEAAETLKALSVGEAHRALVQAVRAPRRKLVFVFSGQGGQWETMGRALLDESEVFAAAVRSCDAALRPYTGFSVEALLRGEATEPELAFEHVDVVQPALFAVSVGLAALWRAWGVEPSAVVGHSQGEVGAAVACGALTLEEGARVVALRSQAVRQRSGQGGMALVELPLAVVEQELKPYAGKLSVGGVNGSQATVVSGETSALVAMMESLQSRAISVRRVNVDYASHSPQMDGLLDELERQLSGLQPRAGQLPFYSTVTGNVLDGEQLGARYWCRNLREPVRFDRALSSLMAAGHDVFVELSAHPVLLPSMNDVSEAGALVVGSLQRKRGDLSQMHRALAELHVGGVEPDWTRVLNEVGGQVVAAPTYAFQRERYWAAPHRARGDGTSLGLSSSGHPLLGSEAPLAGSDTCVFLSALSLRDQPWLGDHQVLGTVLLPGTALLDMALCAGRRLGAPVVAELAQATPLVLDEDADVQLQVLVEAPDADGSRGLRVHSRRAASSSWTLHASGVLRRESFTDAAATEGFASLRNWPPSHTEQLELSSFYAERLRRAGLEYGPAFHGLVEAYRSGSVVYGRVKLAEASRTSVAEYELHPALLDAALHALALVDSSISDEVTFLPFAWHDVELKLTGARELRVRLELQDRGASASVYVADGSGAPVARVGTLQRRPVKGEQLASFGRRAPNHLYRVEARPVTLAEGRPFSSMVVLGAADGLGALLQAPTFAQLDLLLASLPVDGGPELVVIDATGETRKSGAEADAGLAATTEAMQRLQRLLGEPRLRDAEIVWVTRSAAGVTADLEHAPVRGLIRSVRAEQGERGLRLVDLDVERPDPLLFARALGTRHEPELLLRDGRALAPRLLRVEAAGSARRALSDGTVLITGGMGDIGKTVARHLVREHAVRHVVLASRAGGAAVGAAEMVAELRALGAVSAELRKCDVSDRAEVAALLATIAPAQPLTAVFHLAAAALDDAVLGAQTPARLARTFAPKASGALHLHELTRELPLAAFVLFSSATATLGTAGQSTYGAANAFLDALAERRQREGLVATSLAWGLWEQAEEGLTANLGPTERARLLRRGIRALAPDEAMRLMDAALACHDATLVPINLELSALQRAAEREEPVPPLLSSLVGPVRTRAVERPTTLPLRDRLAPLTADERVVAVLPLVQAEVAHALGLSGPGEIDANVELKKLGLDSIMGLEVRRRLAALVGTALPTTLVFDHPTATALSHFLLTRLGFAENSAKDEPPGEPDAALKWALERLTSRQLQDTGLLRRLVQAASNPAGGASEPAAAPAHEGGLQALRAELRAKIKANNVEL